MSAKLSYPLRLLASSALAFGMTGIFAAVADAQTAPAATTARPYVAPATAAKPPVAAVASPPKPTPPPAPISLTDEQAQLLLDALGQAESHGLESRSTAIAQIAEAFASRNPQARQTAEARLVTLTLDYAREIRSGRLKRELFMDKWGLKPPPYDPRPSFVQAVAQNRVGAWLDDQPPPYAGYQDLRGGLATYRAIQAKGGWQAIPAGPAMKLGATGPRVAALRARLAAEDAAVTPQGQAVFDQALADAVIRAQKRFGMAPDGEVGEPTLAALNSPVQRRIDQIVANMERWRWLPPSLPADRVQVNVAAAVLTLFQNDQPTLSMRAATGRPGDETPMLTSEIHSVVLNPPWNVPQGIAAKELWPREKANPGYLARAGYKIIPLPGGGNRLQQAAGPSAALGYIKFDFDNPYAVYLHDTPSRGAFDRYGRLVSHGCVRLQKPIPLANAVFQGDPVWTPEKIAETIASTKTVRVPLPKRISVYLLYWTAYVTPDGQVNFRNDPYGWDVELARRLVAGDTTPA